jgi:hypothetical protein
MPALVFKDRQEVAARCHCAKQPKNTIFKNQRLVHEASPNATLILGTDVCRPANNRAYSVSPAPEQKKTPTGIAWRPTEYSKLMKVQIDK